MDDASGDTARPTWFGSDASPMFGVLHTPAGGAARAGIVICPPIGKEHVDSYRGLKLLAEALCARGFAVLRFDYPGTGDSAGEQRSDTAVAQFQAGVRAAVDYLRAAGVQRVGVVGLRFGALLAASLADRLGEVTAMALWDPVTDGRRYLREGRALYRMTVGQHAEVADADGAENHEHFLGITLSSAAVDDLRALRLPADIGSVPHVLICARPENLGDPCLTALGEQPNCTVAEVAGQPEFVAPPSFVVVIPVPAIAMIADWFDRAIASDRVPVTPLIVTDAVVATSPTGEQVRESLEYIGPARLFTIRTTMGQPGADAPTMLFHSTACEHRIGSGRVWVDSARELAGTGVVAVRYDRRGTGDTGVATTEFARIYSPESGDDVLAAMRGTGAQPQRLMMTGVCSGGSNSAFGALAGGGSRAIVLVNVILYSLRRVEVGPEKLVRMSPPSPGEEPAPQPWLERTVKKLARRWIPYPVWLLLGRLGLIQVPEVLLSGLSRIPGMSVDMVLSPSDAEWFAKQRGARGLQRLAAKGWAPTVVAAPTGDHPLLQRDIQDLVRGHLMTVAMREFPDALRIPVQPPTEDEPSRVPT